MKNYQYCKDCRGLGEITTIPLARCHTCRGTGIIHRHGPYRLQDGTWSDGEDRTRRIDRRPFNSRIAVWKGTQSGTWYAGREFATTKRYDTFEEAAAAAAHLARKQAQQDTP